MFVSDSFSNVCWFSSFFIVFLLFCFKCISHPSRVYNVKSNIIRIVCIMYVRRRSCCCCFLPEGSPLILRDFTSLGQKSRSNIFYSNFSIRNDRQRVWHSVFELSRHFPNLGGHHGLSISTRDTRSTRRCRWPPCPSRDRDRVLGFGMGVFKKLVLSCRMPFRE